MVVAATVVPVTATYPPADAIRACFDAGAFARGVEYARQGAVLSARAREQGHGVVVAGQVRGTAATPYSVEVGTWRTTEGWQVDAECSCPVRVDCKHAAAVLMSLTHDSDPPTPAWEQALGSALEGLEDLQAPAALRTPLALMVDHKTPSNRWGGTARRHQLTLRPVQRGVNGTWVKTGVSWSQVRHMAYQGQHDPAHVELLTTMEAAFLHGYSSHDPQLLNLEGLLWPLLTQCAQVGMPLVPGSSLTSVEVAGPQRLSSDVARTGDEVPDGTLDLRTGILTDDGEWWPEADRHVEFIGHPAHGVALLREVPPPGRRRTPHYALTLAPLSHSVSTHTQRLVEEPLRIPAGHRRQFEQDYLPRLRRQLTVTSRDGSVDLPRTPLPRLELALTWGPGHRAETAWSWCYDDERFALDSLEGLSTVRDVAAETQVLEAVGSDPDLAALTDLGGRFLPRRTWRDRELIDLSIAVLPVLRAHQAAGRLEIVESGSRRDYRRESSEPEISFAVSDDEPPGNDWLDLEIRIAVDGETVPLGEALAALTRRDALVFTESGRHVSTGHPAFERLAELVTAAHDLVDQPPHALRVGHHDVSMWNELEALGVVDAQAEQWLQSARALRSFDGLPTIDPPGIRTELRSYQREGLSWLGFLWESQLGGILADDMGLGKTVQALSLVAHARAQGADPFLVVAPTSVVTAWKEQAAVHAPDLVVRSIGASTARRGESVEQVRAGADVVVTTYTLFRLEAQQYRDLAWGGLLLDEAQHVKNHLGKTYHAIRTLDVPFRLAMTGTPFENRLMELWSLLSIVAPGLYTSPLRFKHSIAQPVERHGDTATLQRLQRRIRPFMLRRTKEQVADDLPPKQEQVLHVELGARHRTIYDTHLQRERQTVLGLLQDFDRNRVAIFRALTRLRQLSLDPGLVDPEHDGVGSAKLDLLVEHLREIVAEGHRVLVFSQFTSYLARVRSRLESAGLSLTYLDGQTRRRDDAIEAFRSGRADVFLISFKAGGVGLTLTEADYVYVLDPWWNPASENQAVDRAHRIGQDKPVMVYRLVSAGTIEEKVMELKQRKAALFDRVLDGDGALSSELTSADVTALFEG